MGGPALLHDVLDRTAARSGQRVALVDGAVRLTYTEVARRADALAAALVAAGLRTGDRVLLLAENGAPAVVAFWAVLKAGGVACPLHPGTVLDKLVYCMTDTTAAVLLVSAPLRALAEKAACRVPGLRVMPIESAAADCARAAPRLPPPDLAAILYTSGSTGLPKGVVLGHDAMCAAVEAIQAYLEYQEDDIVVAALPLAFDYGLYQVLLSFAVGARVLIERSFALLPQVMARMARERATVFPGMPTVFALLAQMAVPPREALAAVRLVTSTGAALGTAQIAWLRDAMPAARLVSMYGLTECKRCTYLPPADLLRKPGSVGVAIPGLALWIEDAEGRRLPPGAIGEIVVRGPTLMRGYWGDPEATRSKLRDTPAGAVLYTGDLGRLDAEGYLYLQGRRDEQIKSRGERVAPREIELALLAVDGVRQAAVVGVPDPVQGFALKAVLVADRARVPDEAHVRQALRGRLEQRLMPATVVFIDAMPLGATGKIDRAALQ